jgi:hypothetical protein
MLNFLMLSVNILNVVAPNYAIQGAGWLAKNYVNWGQANWKAYHLTKKITKLTYLSTNIR